MAVTVKQSKPHQRPQGRWKEALAQIFLAGLPLKPGRMLRNGVYRGIFARYGRRVDLQPGVEFLGMGGIELGDSVRMHPGVRLRCHGPSRIVLHEWAHIDRGVDIRTHQDGQIEIGCHTYLGPYTCLSGDAISIGNYCAIASHSGIYANNHVFDDPTVPIVQQGNSYKGIVIEDDCWLGSGVRVLDGVTIGRGSVIGAGAVVTKNIPPYSIAVGVPAKVVGKRGGDRAPGAAPSDAVPSDVAPTPATSTPSV